MVRRICCRTLAALTLITIAQVDQVDSYGTGFTTCETDTQCGPREFCYESGLCVPCMDCASYRRHNLSEIECAKEAKHCGSCFDGWKDDIFTTGDRRDSCIPSRPLIFRQNPPEHYTADPVIRFAQIGEFVIIAVTAAVFMIGGFLWCRANWTKPSRILPTHTTPEQPRCRPQTRFWDLSENQRSHTSCSSSGSSNGQAEAIRTTIFTAEVLKDVPQQAIPFLRPRYERDDSDEEELEEVVPPQSPDMSFLHDQDTMPSSWTPQANESTSSVETTMSVVNQEAASSAIDESSNDSEQSGPSQAKRVRVSNSESDSGIDVFNPQQEESQPAEEPAINFYITNNVVIHKS
ncbi:hypothetical protein WDU94_013317 [Cyamophila willieti]